MNLKEARELRDKIRSLGLPCVVPLGYAPDSYFARATLKPGSIGPDALAHGPEFYSAYDFESWRAAAKKEHWQRLKHWAEMAGIPKRAFRQLSPIEILIDQACGYDGNGHKAKVAV